MATARDMIEAYSADLVDTEPKCPGAAQSVRLLIAQLQALPPNTEVTEALIGPTFDDILVQWEACKRAPAPSASGNAGLLIAGAVVLYLLFS